MRDEIKNLIISAEENVTNFEKEVFMNDRAFYINAKTLIDDVIEQIVLIKQTVEVEDYVEELYNANKEDLTFIIDTINQLRELVKTKNIHVMVEGKGNYRVQVIGEKEISIDMNTNEVTEKVEEIDAENNEIIEPTIPESDVLLDESAINDFLNNN